MGSAIAAVLLASACGGDGLAPADLQAYPGVACANCRMTVIDGRTVAQIVAKREEPLFFDDLGCLRTYLRTVPNGTTLVPLGTVPNANQLSAEAAIYVADHRTQQWVDAGTAVFAYVPTIDTPMGSHLLAWADDQSRRTDGAAAEADPTTFAALLAETAGGSQ